MAKKTTIEDVRAYLGSRFTKDRGTVQGIRERFRTFMDEAPVLGRDPSLPELDWTEFDALFSDYLWWRGFIRFGNSTGCCGPVHEERYRMCAHDTGPGDTVVFNSFTLPSGYPGVREATEDETEEFLRKCYRNGRVYDGSGFVRVPRIKAGDWIVEQRYAHLPVDCSVTAYIVTDVSGEEAVVARIDPENFSGEICAERVGLWRTPYADVGVSRRKRLLAEMSEEGLVYDRERLVFVRSIPRADMNGTYWYVTDNFTIRAEADRRTPTHSRRYTAGNYFTSPEEAAEFLSRILGLLRHRARPSV